MKKRLCVILVGILIFIYCFQNNSIAETKVDELRNKRQEAQDKITENTLQLDQVENEISDLMAQIQTLSDDIYKSEVQVAILNEEINELNNKIQTVRQRLNNVERKYNNRKKMLAERVIAQYENGNIEYIDFLLNSKGLIDFISRFYLIGEIADLDTEIIKDYEMQKKQIEEEKSELEEYQKELKIKKNEQESVAIVLENKRIVKNNQMNGLSEKERQLQAEIDEYQKAIQETEIELLMILTANLDSDYVGGTLAWPVPGYITITSKFGMRIHPISGVYKMHTGVDIGAPLRSYFVAANDGIVVTSKYSESYGNMVVVDHGGGMSTLYAHGTDRLVEVGDTVKRGQPVLTIGSTGISTGPHAHFEVRINGAYVDPLDYILNKNTLDEKKEEQSNEEN